MIPMAVLVIELSRTVTEPTVCAVRPPPFMAMPVLQLLMETLLYVQPQDQIWLMAVTAL